MESYISKKTVSRLAAIQGLYQYEMNERTQTSQEIIETIIDFYKSEDIREDIAIDQSLKLSANYLTELVSATITHSEEIDQIIKENLSENWVFENLNPSLVAILRLAICELKYLQKTPFKVIINEYTTFTNDFSRESDVAFVNSLLDKLAKQFNLS